MDPSRPLPDALVTRLANSQTLRLLTLGFLVLLLQVPIFMIDGLVRERRGRRDEATGEVSSKWGAQQTVVGPVLVLPYAYRRTEEHTDRPATTRTETRSLFLLPDELHIQGRLESETRSRGIFAIPVYRLRMSLAGSFGRPDLAALGIDPRDVAWDRAHLAIGVSDIPAIQEQPVVTWNGRPHGFQPGLGRFSDFANGIHAPVPAGPQASGYAFDLPLSLRGSVGLYFSPFGRQTVVEIESNAPSPSFQGKWLPTEGRSRPTVFGRDGRCRSSAGIIRKLGPPRRAIAPS